MVNPYYICNACNGGRDMPSYEIITPHGVFQVIQSLTYGEMIISTLIIILIVITGLRFLWEVAVREGWF